MTAVHFGPVEMSAPDKYLEAEEAMFQLEVVDSFASRGWALYECNVSHPFYSLYALPAIVGMGRAKKLEYGIKYILLPLCKYDANWEKIARLIEEVKAAGRGPYFIEIEEGKDGIRGIARFFIDSIVLSPPFLYLQPDFSKSNVRDPSRIPDLLGKAIEIHLTELWRIRKQLLMALRR